ncbi:MAG TPA: isoprenylcysteine carboxylmethyltransferase family protein [Anaerolineae bacterium]|nr:isoprenylcysteine carboxylmethyltransferase family protein [Anaerolineae bacterium]
MNSNTSAEQENGKPDITGVIVKYMLQAGLFTLVQVASLFIASGRLDWVMAWVYIGVYLAGMGVNALVLIPTNPELVVERAQFRGKKDLDRALAGVMALYGPAGPCIVAGLDVRLGWSPGIPPALLIVALAIGVLGSLLTTWAMASNSFFYGVLRIAKDRGHTVATGGPYRYVRHPGYVGIIAFDLATPLILGSLWALIPAALAVCLAIVRTTLEDKTLHEELGGYKEYAARVPHRLLPRVW